MNMKSTSLALALCVSGPAMAMTVHPSETVPSRVANAISTFQSKSKAFVFQDDTETGAPAAADKASDTLVQPETLVEAVPEPETWALLAVGLGAIGLVSRRRRKSINR